ncbi:MAG: GumC family protein [Halothece sp.]
MTSTTNTHNSYQEANDFGYGQVLGMFWRRRYWFVATFLIIFSTAGWRTLQREPNYQSRMQILVEPNYQDADANRREFSELTENNIEIDYYTQLSLMRSSGLLEEAVERLQEDYPNLEIWELQGNLQLERVEEDGQETKLFQANYTDGDPIKAQKVLAVMLEVYQEYNLEQQQQRLERGLSFTNEQIVIARENLKEMEDNLEAFREENELITPEQKAQALSSRLNAIEANQEEVRATYQGTLARYSLLQSQVGRSTPEAINSARLSESPLYQRLLEQIQANREVLIEERTRFTDDNPTVQVLLEKEKALSNQLEATKARLLNADGGTNSAEQLGRTELDLIRDLLLLEGELDNLLAKQDQLVQEESQLRSQLNQFPTLLAEYDGLQQEIEVQRAALQELLTARQDLGIELNRGGFNWEIVEPPLTGNPVGPTQKEGLLLAGVVALFLSGIVVAIRELLDNAIHSSDQLQQNALLPLLGVVPKWKSSSRPEFSLNLSLYSASKFNPAIFQWQPFREALDVVNQNIQLFGGSSRPKSITVTSALMKEGKSTLTIGLALSVSRLNQRVLVIDSNFREPVIHEILQIPNEEGLNDFFKGKVQLPPVQTVNIFDSQIDVLTAGSGIDDPMKFLSSQSMKQLIKRYEQIYDLVLIDVPAVLGIADAMPVAASTEATVLVSRIAKIHEIELQSAISLLGKFNLIGMIANGGKDNTSRTYATPKLRSVGLSPSVSASNSSNGYNQ